jgi:hypothetical protein
VVAGAAGEHDLPRRRLAGPRELWDAFGATGDNILLARASWWLSLR